MEKAVYIVLHDLGYDGKHIKRVFDREYDAKLYMEGADAVCQSLKMETWPVYQHGPQEAARPATGEQGEGR